MLSLPQGRNDLCRTGKSYVAFGRRASGQYGYAHNRGWNATRYSSIFHAPNPATDASWATCRKRDDAPPATSFAALS